MATELPDPTDYCPGCNERQCRCAEYEAQAEAEARAMNPDGLPVWHVQVRKSEQAWVAVSETYLVAAATEAEAVAAVEAGEGNELSVSTGHAEYTGITEGPPDYTVTLEHA